MKRVYVAQSQYANEDCWETIDIFEEGSSAEECIEKESEEYITEALEGENVRKIKDDGDIVIERYVKPMGSNPGYWQYDKHYTVKSWNVKGKVS